MGRLTLAFPEGPLQGLTRSGAVGVDSSCIRVPVTQDGAAAARRVHIPEVAGSNPAPATIFETLPEASPF